MSVFVNPIDNNVLAAFAGQASKSVVSAIQGASKATGVDFAYLMQQASAESSFNPTAKASTSSASGLYQFIESTWIQMVEKHGHKYGIDKTVPKEEILALRNDPELASKLAAELAKDNKEFLEINWGGEVGSTELYFAHFLGAGGASSFLNARDENPLKIAADLFPSAAKANRNVFYDPGTGRARTLEEVYQFFDKKFQIGEEVKAETVEDLMVENFQNGVVAHEFGKPAKTRSYSHGVQPMIMSPIEVMIIAQLEVPLTNEAEKKNRLF